MTAITSKRHLNPPRRHRAYPRAVKRAARTRYRVKRPGDNGTRHHGPPAVRLLGPKPQGPSWAQTPWQWPQPA
jgi:hypothetical protein